MICIEVGKWNKLPHLSVIGNPQDFYISANNNGITKYSERIKGKEAIRNWHDLKNTKNKKVLREKIERLFEQYSKTTPPNAPQSNISI